MGGAATFSLNPEQVTALDAATGSGTRDFWRGYQLVEDERDNGRLSLDDGTAYWFRLAIQINRNDIGSLANHFIRSFAMSGLGGAADNMQAISDAIGAAVVGNLLRGTPMCLTDMVEDDIGVAIAKFGMTIGGWGGSFYYWNLVYGVAGRTIGEQIVGDDGEHAKFVRGMTDATVAVVEAFASDPARADLTGSEDAAWKGIENVPSATLAQISERALERLLRDTVAVAEHRGLGDAEAFARRIRLAVGQLLPRV